MLTDYYAVWQPTKVNTGASFNLLQSPRFPCWARLRCTGLLAELGCRAHLHVLETSLPANGRLLSPPIGFSGVGQEQRDRRQPREGTERETGPTRCSPSTLPPVHPVCTAAIRSTGSCTAGSGAICQRAPRVSQPAELALLLESSARCFSQLCPECTSQHSS